jgi:hypothetical protein
MIAGVAYLRSSIPPGSLILADHETARLLCFYLPGRHDLPMEANFDDPQGAMAGPYRVVWRSWDFGEVNQFLEDLASVRRERGLSRDAPVWIVDGGFDNGLDARIRNRFPGISLPSFHDFDGALTVFQTPSGI